MISRLLGSEYLLGGAAIVLAGVLAWHFWTVNSLQGDVIAAREQTTKVVESRSLWIANRNLWRDATYRMQANRDAWIAHVRLRNTIIEGYAERERARDANAAWRARNALERGERERTAILNSNMSGPERVNAWLRGVFPRD